MRFNTVGERIKHARKQSGLSVKALADATGLAVSTIYDVERGDSKSTTKLPAVARATGFSALWLEREDGPEKINQAANPPSFPTNTVPAEPVRFKTIDPDILRQALDVVDEHIGRDPSDNQRIANWIAEGYAEYMRTLAADTEQIRRAVSTVIHDKPKVEQNYGGGITHGVRHE